MKGILLHGLAALAICHASADAAEMLDASADKPGEPWCYLAKSTTVIGVPAQPDVTQVTFDGALFTGSSELCFFYGADSKPLLARGKSFQDGWMPIVGYTWTENGIAYEIECFAFPLEGEGAENTVNFVRARLRNISEKAQSGRFIAAMRHSSGDYRFHGSVFDPKSRYEIKYVGGCGEVWRDNCLVHTFSDVQVRAEMLPGRPYAGPFKGSDHGIESRTECALSRYSEELKPGEMFEMTFRMPRVPVAASRTSFLKKLTEADYAGYRRKTVAFWKGMLQDTARFEIPESKVQDSRQASLVHLLLATRKWKEGWTQTDGLPYPDFFLTSVPQAVRAYLTSGHPDYARNLVTRAISYQEPDGLYLDRALAHGKKIAAAQGHIMYAAALTVLYSQDRKFGGQIYPSLRKSVEYVSSAMANSPHGLLPPAWPYDNEMILGEYTSNNTWALLGLRNLVRVARFLNHPEDEKAWTAVAQRLEKNILKGIDVSASPDGYVPPGLYPYLTGGAAREGFTDTQTNCDWENMLLAFPSELLAPGDPKVKGTVDHIRKGYAEGIMTYRHGMHLHQYITANQAEQYLAMGDDYTALKDFYHILLHTGSTGEGFENLVRPWTDRAVAPDCPAPHAWASSKIACLVRDLVLLEYGGKCGMEPSKRELWLFHCLSPAWVDPGKKVAFTDAPTEFGTISAAMVFRTNGADVSIRTKFHESPSCFRLRMPYFKEAASFTTDAKSSKLDGDCLILSPDATRVSLVWRDKPSVNPVTDILADYRAANVFKGSDKEGKPIVETPIPFLTPAERSVPAATLSFNLVKETFLLEYRRRASEVVQQGGGTVKVMALPIVMNASRPAGPQMHSEDAPIPQTKAKDESTSLMPAR